LATVVHAGRAIAAQLGREGNRVLLTLSNSVIINTGEKLEITLG